MAQVEAWVFKSSMNTHAGLIVWSNVSQARSEYEPDNTAATVFNGIAIFGDIDDTLI